MERYTFLQKKKLQDSPCKHGNAWASGDRAGIGIGLQGSPQETAIEAKRSGSGI
jgi:hypothetical protein